MMDKKRFAGKKSILVKEFDRHILEHPEFADEIPDNAYNSNSYLFKDRGKLKEVGKVLMYG